MKSICADIAPSDHIVISSLCQVREDGRTWFGCLFITYNHDGHKISERIVWDGYFTTSRGIDNPTIRKHMPFWNRWGYALGFYRSNPRGNDTAATNILKNILCAQKGDL